MSKTYTLTITARQAALIRDACEVLARLGMGQIRDALDHLPTDEFRPTSFHETADTIVRMLEPLMKPSAYYPNQSPYRQQQRENMEIAWDLYQVIRHRLSWDYAIENGIIKPGEPRNWKTMMGVNYDEPPHRGGEPLAKMEAAV